MTNFKIYITLFFLAFLVGCSSTKESSSLSKSSKSNNTALADLPEEKRIEFKFLFHNANKERLLENYQLAVNLFLKCIEIAPNEAAPHYELAHIFNSFKEKQLTLEHAKKAAKIDPKNYWYNILYAQALQSLGKTPEAIKLYETLIEKNEGNLDLYFDLAGMQLFSGKYKDAIASFNEIEKRMGITEEISVQKEKIYLKLNDVDKAANEIQQLINEYPDDLRYQVILADLYMINNLPDKAFEVYQEILEKDPKNPYANLSLYDYYLSKGEEEKATEAIKKAFSSPALDVDTKVKILLSYYTATTRRLKAEALELNKILIKTHPKEAKAYTIYADFLYQEKKLESAKENYLKAIEFDDSKLPIWNQLIFIESELQDNESLLRDSKRAIDLFPNQPIFYFFYGATNLQKKEFKEAVDFLSIGKDYVIENPPLLAQFYANLGDAYYGLKEYEKSDKAYESALKIEPKNIYVLNNYSYYLSLREDKLERAEELSALCNEIEPDQANYQDTYAWILYKQGKFIQAKEWLEKALENGGKTNSVILEHLGDTHSQLHNITKALEYWTKAKELNDGETSEFLDKKIADKKLYE